MPNSPTPSDPSPGRPEDHTDLPGRRDARPASPPEPTAPLPGGGSTAQPPADSVHDITGVLKGWDYEPGSINVRKVAGRDGREKLQMRLDLGLLQMELTGRPDGRRPHDCDSYLEFLERELAAYRAAHGGGAEGFELDADRCQSLREEAVMYYYRYLSLFVLAEFDGVVRDTARNLRVLDLCARYAADEQDRLVLEQYRPYIIMMNTRAAASIEFRGRHYERALGTVTGGLDQIREFFLRFGQEEAFEKSSEVKVLKRFARDIRRRLPTDPVDRLQSQLRKAVRREDYEEAARLRDRIAGERGPSGA